MSKDIQRLKGSASQFVVFEIPLQTMMLSTRTSCTLLYLLVSSTMGFQTVARNGGWMTRSDLLSRAATSSPSCDQHSLSIEYCTGCRWMLKSFWMAQELLTTFENDLKAVTILPSSSKGIFAVRLDGNELLWDRKEQGGFPSPKGLKQIVRDMVEPEKFLGHSDTQDRQLLYEGKVVESIPQSTENMVTQETDIPLNLPELQEPSVVIHYCTGCRWLLRAAYFGQELLTTFSDEIKSVTLVPSKPPSKGGRFVSTKLYGLTLIVDMFSYRFLPFSKSIELNGETIFDRATEGRFPEVKEIKQMIRDRIIPDKDLGHSDNDEGKGKVPDQLSDDDAALQRRLFGVD